MSNPNTHIVNDQVFALRRKSKWTWEAIQGDQKVVATAPSRPKLKAKLDSMFDPKPAIVETISNASRQAKDEKKEVAETKKSTSSKSKRKSKSSKKDKKQSMRSMTLQLIRDGEDDESILKFIQQRRPNAKYDMSHVKWYRSNFAKTGLIGPEHAPLGSKMYKEWLSKQ